MGNSIENYRKAVRDVILEYATHKPSHGAIETKPLIDEETGSYQVVDIGWLGKRRIFGVILHIDIINGKVWIQYDGTEHGVARDLIAAGVPRESIVLGYKPANVRQYTEFAVA